MCPLTIYFQWKDARLHIGTQAVSNNTFVPLTQRRRENASFEDLQLATLNGGWVEDRLPETHLAIWRTRLQWSSNVGICTGSLALTPSWLSLHVVYLSGPIHWFFRISGHLSGTNKESHWRQRAASRAPHHWGWYKYSIVWLLLFNSW